MHVSLLLLLLPSLLSSSLLFPPPSSSLPPIQSNNLYDLISYNLNLLEKIPENSISRELIEKSGKVGVLSPNLIDFVIFSDDKALEVEGMGDVEGEICGDCLMERLVGTTDEESISNKLSKLYNNQKQSFLYVSDDYSAPESMKENLIRLKTEGKVTIQEESTGAEHSSAETLYQCVNGFLNKEFKFDFESSKIFDIKKKTDLSLSKGEFSSLIKDLCAFSTLSRMVRNDGKQNLLVFNVRMDASVRNVWSAAMKKFIKNIKERFSSDEISGQIIRSVSSLAFIQKRNLNEVAAQTNNVKDDVPYQVWSNYAHYQAYIWLPVVLAFVLFFSVMALVNLDFSKDTLLYAKFITSDNR